MALEDRSLFGESRRAKPSQASAGTQARLRASNRGELVVQGLGKPAYALADEGSYFLATNPTPGTGIIGIAAADGYDATESLLVLQNGSTAAEDVRVYLDFLEIACTVVDASGTNVRYDMHVDNIDRYTSGGSTITPVNCNMDSTEASKAVPYFGAVVSPAASSDVRYLGGRLVSSTDLVADDTFRFDFGGDGAGAAQGLSSAEHATLNTYVREPCPPIVLGPGDAFLFTVNCASQAVTGATWTFKLGYWER